MNARQKAKHYKRMYKELLNKPLKLNVINHKVDTLKGNLSFSVVV